MNHLARLGTATAASTSVGAVTVGSAVAAGATVILTAAWSNDTAAVPTITSVVDSRGNSYAVDASGGTGNATVSCAIIRATVTTPLQVGDTITVTITANRFRWVLEANAFDGVGALDQIGANHTPGVVAAMSTGVTPETTAPDELLIAAFGFGRGSGAESTLGAGWSGGGYVTTSVGSADRALQTGYRVVAATGPQEGTATLTVASAYSACIATYVSADAGPSGTGSASVTVTASGTGAKGAAGTGTATAPAAEATAGPGVKGAAGTGAVEVTVSASGSGNGPVKPAAFPDVPLDVLVELQIDGVWTDITEDVYLRDEITISRGRADEGPRADPAEVSLTLDNRSGKYSARNPLSPLYGKIGRNTPIRITARGEDWSSSRFAGEVASWPPKWDVSGEDRYVPITAAGILRRLGQGQKALRSALYRSIAGTAPYTAWWPMEDGPGATQAASGYPGQAPARLVGDAKMTDTPAGGVAGGVEISETGRVIAGVPGGTAEWIICFWLDLPINVAAEDVTPFVQWRTPGALKGVSWDIVTAGGLNGVMLLEAIDQDNNIIWSTPGSIDIRGRGPVQIVVAAYQDGGIVQVRSYVNGVQDIVAGIGADRAAPVTAIGLNAWTLAGDTRYTGVTSHLLVAPYARLAELLGHAAAGAGYVGERAADRIMRICAEEGIPVIVTGDPAESAEMGPQQPRTPLELLEECAVADDGTLGEQRDAIGLQYRTRTEDYNTVPAVVLDYAAGDIAPPLEPIEDDQAVRNDITATRTGGSSAQVVIEEGPLSIQPPPDGVGRYDEGVTVNVATDEQLLDVAGWRAHMGTWDEARFPTVPIDLAAAPHLIPDMIELDARTHVQLVNLPDEVPPGPVNLLVDGYTEVIGDFDWDITLNASPAGPWTVGVIEDEVLGHVDTDGSELAAAAAAADTVLSVAVTDGPLWTLDPADLPFDVVLGGEVVTVTAIAGAASPQTMTVVRSVNGVTKSHDAGTDIRLAHPAVIAR